MKIYYFGDKNRILRVNKLFQERAICLNFRNLHSISKDDIILTNRAVLLLFYIFRILKVRPLLVYVSDGLISPLLKGKDQEFILENSVFDFMVFNQPFLNVEQIGCDRKYINNITNYKTNAREHVDPEIPIKLVLPNNPYLSCTKYDYLEAMEKEYKDNPLIRVFISAKSKSAKKLETFLKKNTKINFIDHNTYELLSSKEAETYILSGASSTFIYNRNYNTKFVCIPYFAEYFTPMLNNYLTYSYEYLSSEHLLQVLIRTGRYNNAIHFKSYKRKLRMTYIIREIQLLLRVFS